VNQDVSRMGDFVRRTPVARALLAGPRSVRRMWMDHQRRPMQQALHRLETLVTSDLRLRIDEFEGEFVLGPRSHLLHRLLASGYYEPELVALFRKHLRPDRDVIDVGANVGFFTVLAGKHLTSGRVLAAEPTSSAFKRLQENVGANRVADRVILFNGAVSDAERLATMHVVPGREEYSSVGEVAHPSVAGEATSAEQVGAKSIDQLVREHGLKPALMKIDVEGGEGPVFAGAEETLRDHRPVVISEFSPSLLRHNGTDPEAILSLLRRCDYEVRDLRDARLTPGTADFRDIIAIPR
jgi:FkbM family methyltransferase